MFPVDEATGYFLWKLVEIVYILSLLARHQFNLAEMRFYFQHWFYLIGVTASISSKKAQTKTAQFPLKTNSLHLHEKTTHSKVHFC